MARICLARLEEESVLSCQMFFNLCVPVFRSDKVIRGAYASHQEVTFLYHPYRLRGGCIWCWKKSTWKGSSALAQDWIRHPWPYSAYLPVFVPPQLHRPPSSTGEWDGAPSTLNFRLFCVALMEADRWVCMFWGLMRWLKQLPHTSYTGFNHSTRKEGLDFLKGVVKWARTHCWPWALGTRWTCLLAVSNQKS